MTKTDTRYAIAIIFILFCGMLSMMIIANQADQRADRYKLQLDQKDSQIYERQLKYEEEKSIKEQLGRELVGYQKRLGETKERLAEAEARERSARARASRSRSFGGSRASESREGSSASKSVASGPLRDITMYCPTGNRTASGKWPARGMVATISRSIPFGTHVRIDGLGVFVVEDRIGHSSEFDIFTPSCGEARRFGRKHLRVTILDTD